MVPDTCLHTFLKEAKGVWLEVGDNIPNPNNPTIFSKVSNIKLQDSPLGD